MKKSRPTLVYTSDKVFEGIYLSKNYVVDNLT